MRVLLVVYDNASFIHTFPTGLAYIAAVLRKAGHDVRIYNQDKYHYPDDHITTYLDENIFDAIGIGIIAGYYQYKKLLKLSDAINGSKHRPFFILGGHGPSPEPAFFLSKTGADAVVIGEGEKTVVELMNALYNRQSLKSIKGLAYRDGDKVLINAARPLIEDLDTLPLPAYNLFPIDYYRLIRMPNTTHLDFVLPVLSARGCTFKCNFCYRMDEGYRTRSDDSIVEEIGFLQKEYGITYIIFQDELLMSSEERTINLCEAIIRADLDIKWRCEGRLNYAKPDVLKRMKTAGCVFINYGIESLDDRVLKKMNKGLTCKQIHAGIETTLNAGISPGFNVLFGNIGDTKETLQKGLNFLLKYDDGTQLRTIRPVTPYPGSQLYDYAIECGELKDCQDFYETKHVNSDLVSVNFTNIGDEEVHCSLLEANTALIKNHYRIKIEATLDQAKALYLEQDSNFRGFRTT